MTGRKTADKKASPQKAKSSAIKAATSKKKPSEKQQRLYRCRAEDASHVIFRAEEAYPKNKRRRGGADVQNSVIKLFASHTQPNYSQPWCSDMQTSSTSTAWPIRLASGALRLVTNAHSVEHATLIQVKRHQHEKKFVAKVLSIGPDCDLALLEVPSSEFWKGLDPLELFLGLPELQDAVSVVGYPTGGDNLSVTQGIVSRVDLVEYAQSGMMLLGIQIDAAINSGNSGGPVVDSNSRCIGVAFQNLSGDEDGAENIGYVIPSEIVLHFLQDVQIHGRFTGFGTAGFQFQSLESPSLRAALGLNKGESGVRVKSVDAVGPSHGLIQPDDIIVRIDGHQVANDGTVAFKRGRIPFPYLVHKHFTGEKCKIQLIRPSNAASGSSRSTSKKECVEVTVQRARNLVDGDAGGPHSSAGCLAPRYLIVGGLVFVPLTRPFLASAFGENYESERPSELSTHLLHLLESGEREHADHEPIVLTQVLASEVTMGYSDTDDYEVLESFNGTKVKNLKHLSELLEKSNERFQRYSFQSKLVLVLESSLASKHLQTILEQHMIPAAKSRLL
jgi:S1-C subfamily serine protease